MSDDEEVRKDPPETERVERARDYLSTYCQYSRVHAEQEIVAELGVRSGAVRAIDIEDFRPEDKAIDFRHRPESKGERGTPLKNGKAGDRSVNISNDLRDVLLAYRRNPNQPEGTDKYGRRPLFTAEDSDGTVGRIAVGRVRDDLYRITRPCEVGQDCPVDRDVSDCKVAKNRYAYECPENYTPHPLRSWSIMFQLDQGVERGKLSNRVDVSVPVLKKHYDHRSEERKRKARLDELEEKLPGYGEDSSKSTSADFDGIPGITNPALAPVVLGTELSRFVRSRLHLELQSICPDGTERPTPGPRKVVKEPPRTRCSSVC